VTFDTLQVHPHAALLTGGQAALEISQPLGGIWRLRSRPLSGMNGFPPKHSFAVVGAQPLPFTSERLPGSFQFSAGATRLQITEQGSWQLWQEDRPVLSGSGSSGEWLPGSATRVYRSRLNLDAPAAERYFGLGEKTGPLNRRGLRYTFWNTDTLPHLPDTDPMYQSIPFLLVWSQGRVHGLFLDEPARSQIDLACSDPERLTWEVEGPELDLYAILGPTPQEVLERYTALTGRPAMPALWVLGAHQSRWGYSSAEEIRSVIEGYRRHALPLDAVHLDIDYMNAYKVFTFDPQRFPDPLALAEQAAEQGVRLITIIDPGVKAEPGYTTYDQALSAEYLVRTDRGEPLLGEVWPDPAVFPDFTRPEVRSWWGEQHRPLLEAGIAGIWNDMNEPSCASFHSAVDLSEVVGRTLPDSARHGTRRHLEVHNVYGLTMSQATFEALERLRPGQRPFVLSRAGFAGIQRYSAVWGGDNSSYWEHLEANLTMLLSMSLSGLSLIGCDVGGFGGHSSAELLVRWTQLGAFYPLMRNHSARGTRPQEPWTFGQATTDLVRGALELRYRLLPLLYTLMWRANQTGTPPMRPLLWHYPEDPIAASLSDSFTLGPSLLVAPVLRPEHRHRAVYFPSSGWVRVDQLDGQVYPAGFRVVEAELSTIPLFLAPGGILPLAEVAQHTGTAHWDKLTWMLNPATDGRFDLYEDAGDGPLEGELASLRIERHPDRIRLQRSGVAHPGEQLVLLGLPHGASVSASSNETEEALYIEPDSDWSELEIRF
jgi:alpha-glucosidase